MGLVRGDVEKLRHEVRNEAGELADPTSLELLITQPDGTVVTRKYSAEGSPIVRESKGVYYSILDLTEAGDWAYRWEATGTGISEADEGVLVVGGAVESIPSKRKLTLVGLRPSPRYDGKAWTQARVDVTDAAAGDSGWTTSETVTLEEPDEEPKQPAVRSLTVAATKRWVRVVFLDAEGGEDEPSPRANMLGPDFRPAVSEVAAVMRARTYSAGSSSDLGGELIEDFTEDTRPTGEFVETRLIPQACEDVMRSIGRGLPVFLLENARRLAVLKTAAEIERSFIPEQSDETRTTYQTLRLTFNEEMAKLMTALQWWTLAMDVDKNVLAPPVVAPDPGLGWGWGWWGYW